MKSLKIIFPLLVLFFLVLAVMPAYAANSEIMYAAIPSGTLYQIDTGSNTVTSTIPTSTDPWFLCANPSGSYVYIADDSMNNRIAILQPISNNINYIALPQQPGSLVTNSNGTMLYVALETEVAFIPLNSNGQISYVPIPGANTTQAITITPDGSKLYVTDIVTNKVYVISTISMSVIATINVGTYPFSIAASPLGDKVFVTSNDNVNRNSTVSVISTATNTIISNITTPWYADWVTVDKSGNSFYLSCGYNHIVQKYSMSTYALQGSVSIPTSGYGADDPTTSTWSQNGNLY